MDLTVLAVALLLTIGIPARNRQIRRRDKQDPKDRRPAARPCPVVRRPRCQKMSLPQKVTARTVCAELAGRTRKNPLRESCG